MSNSKKDKVKEKTTARFKEMSFNEQQEDDVNESFKQILQKGDVNAVDLWKEIVKSEDQESKQQDQNMLSLQTLQLKDSFGQAYYTEKNRPSTEFSDNMTSDML